MYFYIVTCKKTYNIIIWNDCPVKFDKTYLHPSLFYDDDDIYILPIPICLLLYGIILYDTLLYDTSCNTFTCQ